MRIQNLEVGLKWERLTVKNLNHSRGKRGDILISCDCSCGGEWIGAKGDFKTGRVRSCGCLKSELLAQKNTTHGMAGSSEYNSWANMIQRCTNENHPKYPDYGARGIRVCERWLNSFEDFLADMGLKPVGKNTIERIENNGNYEPGNCRWASNEEQQKNTRQNLYLTLDGRTLCAADWAREIGIPPKTLRARKTLGWSDERALTEPLRMAVK